MNEQQQAQEQGHRIWSIVRLFYHALIKFREQYNRYEEKVLNYARASGLSREVLRLNSAELAGLLDFKSLEDLRDGTIRELKDLCHLVFRTDHRTDYLDRYVSDIFHEVSIIKEEHYTVKIYAPMYEKDEANYELQYILDEAHAMFPQKLRYIHHLFGKARERLEQHLPSFCDMPIVIRSLYLQRDGFVKEAYPDGLRDFYRIMYPWGAFEGYYRVGLSFYHSGFFPECLEAFRAAETEYDRLIAGIDRGVVEHDVIREAFGGNTDSLVGAESSNRRSLRAMRRALSIKRSRVERARNDRSSASVPNGERVPEHRALRGLPC